MRSQPVVVVVFAVALGAACGSESPPPRSPEQRGTDSAPATASLRAGQFADAATQANAALALDPDNSQAAAVRAIAGYQRAGHDLFHELEQVMESADDLKFFDHEAGRAAWQTFLDRLDAIDKDLAVVAADPAFS